MEGFEPEAVAEDILKRHIEIIYSIIDSDYPEG